MLGVGLRRLLALSLWLAGCSLTTDLAGFSAESTSADSEDRSVEDAAAADGQEDAPVGDGGASDRSSADFCAGATFCDRFERTDPTGEWDPPKVSNGSSLTLTTMRAHSGTSAMRTSFATGGSSAALHKTLGTAKKVRLEYAVYLEELPMRDINIGSIDYHFAGRSNGVYFVFGGGQAKATEQEINDQGTMTHNGSLGAVALVTGRWVVLTIEVDHTVTPQLATLTYDGVVVADRKPLARSYPPSAPKIVAGSDYASPGAAFRIDFDDLRVDLTP
ncbi:MAG: hypothetical protein KF795_22625 [Labilithrix sp.]|nr:hypothetical protein [Labilithrix sp.]